MGKTKIYLLLAVIPILFVLVTVNLHSQSQLTDHYNKIQITDHYNKIQKTDSKAPDVIRHKVKSGDSLLSLAYMYRSSAEDIKMLNKITRDDIYAGEVLKIPYNSEGYDRENRYIRYKVHKGDSLSELALRFKTDIDSIRQINKLDNNQINYGQRIEIPYGLKLADNDAESAITATGDGNGSDYKRDPENKYNKILISEEKDSTANQLIRTDNENEKPNEVYSVKEETYNSDYQDLEKNLKNNLSDRKMLDVTSDSAGLAKENDVPESSDSDDSMQKSSGEHTNTNTELVTSIAVDYDRTVEYVVKNGDNLSSIAEEYHATAAELKEFNKLQANVLQPGQKIIIPKYDFIRYRIQNGDNLSTIASNNNTTVKELKELNDLKSGNVYIGQRIKIPLENNKVTETITEPDAEVSLANKSKDDDLNATSSNSTEDTVIDEYAVRKEVEDKREISNVAKISPDETSVNKGTSNQPNPVQPIKSNSDKIEELKITSKSNNLDVSNLQKTRADNKLAISKADGNELKSDNPSLDLAEIAKEPIAGSNVNNSNKVSERGLNNTIDSKDKNTELAAAALGGSVHDELAAQQENSDEYRQIRSDDTEIPAANKEISHSYEVASGDSLSMLAVRFNTSVSALKLANDLDSNQINIGQNLVIPSATESGMTEITDNSVTISRKSDKSESISEHETDKSPDNETPDSNVGNEISEVVKKSESDTDSDKIKNQIKNIAAENTNSDKTINEKADTLDVKLRDNVVKQSETEDNGVIVASLEDNTVAASESADKIQNKIGENIKPDNELKETTRGIEEVKVSEDKIEGTENKSLQITDYENAPGKDIEVENSDNDKANTSGEPAVAPVNRVSNVPEDSVENNISDLEYKADYDTELKNKVTLAQLITLEQNSVPSEEDRYHTLVEEQVLLTKSDTADKYVQATAPSPSPVEITESGEEIVNFPGEIDLRDLVQTMSEITNESFIVDDKLQAKKVTIITPKGGFSKSNAIRLFEAILDLNGFTVYRSGAVNIVTEKRDIKSVPLPIQEGRVIGTLSERYITQIVPLKNIKAQDVANSLKPLISREGDIVVYEPLNTLIIVETKTNLNKILIILQNIDKEKEIVFVKIYNSDAADISAMLTEIFGGTSASPVTSAEQTDARTRRRSVTRRTARAQQTSAGGEVEITGFKIITDERTNSLIVIAYPEDIPKIKAAIERLDVQIDEPEHGIYLIRLKNADAEQVVNVLNSLISGVPLTSRTAGETTRTTGRTTQSATQTTSGTLTEFEIDDVRITADASTNSVIIVGSRREYESIKRVVDEIDIRRKQVYVEAAILEVALDQLKSLGTNLSLGFTFNEDNLGFGGTNLPGIPSLLGAAADTENAVTAVGSLSGMFLGVIGEEVDPDGSGPIPPIPSFTALFQALTSVTDVNILSTPSIVTTDNEEAEIVVADVIPFPTGSTVGDSGVTVQTIDREPVGIRLAITPQIGDGDFLNLQLQTEVSSIRDAPADLNTAEFGIATATRTATSSVVVKNGQTIVIGGLVQDRESTLENKVPALGNLPVLGNLFKFKSRSNSKINLMILLTPRIIDDEKDMRLILEDRQKRNMLLQERNIEEERLLLE